MQTTALTVKHQLTDFQRSQQPTLIARAGDALTRPDPIRITTAPQEGPPEIMAQAPNAYQLGHLKYYDGPPQQTVHPAPPDVQRPSSHTPAAQCADVVTEMRAVELLRT